MGTETARAGIRQVPHHLARAEGMHKTLREEGLGGWAGTAPWMQVRHRSRLPVEKLGGACKWTWETARRAMRRRAQVQAGMNRGRQSKGPMRSRRLRPAREAVWE